MIDSYPDIEFAVVKLAQCYELKSLGLNNRTTLVLSDIRELNRDPFTK